MKTIEERAKEIYPLYNDDFTVEGAVSIGGLTLIKREAYKKGVRDAFTNVFEAIKKTCSTDEFKKLSDLYKICR